MRINCQKSEWPSPFLMPCGQSWRLNLHKKLFMRQDFLSNSFRVYLPEARREIRARQQDHQFLSARLARKRFFQIKWMFVFVALVAFSMSSSWTTKINSECHLRLNKLRLRKEKVFLRAFESAGKQKPHITAAVNKMNSLLYHWLDYHLATS